MTIDLSTLKVGDQVRYRKGTVDTILNIEIVDSAYYPIELTTSQFGKTLYTKEGIFTVVERRSEWDIVEIIPKTIITNVKTDSIGTHIFYTGTPPTQAQIDEYIKSEGLESHKIEGGDWFNLERDVNHKPFVDYNPATAKTDTGKDRLDLLPYAGLASAAKAFEYGLNQYGHNNYQNAKSFRPFLAAAIRHTMKKLDGEDLDKDSGLDHISHSLACLLMAEQIKSQGKPINDPDTMKPYGIRNKPKE